MKLISEKRISNGGNGESNHGWHAGVWRWHGVISQWLNNMWPRGKGVSESYYISCS